MTLSVSGALDLPPLADDVAVISVRDPGDPVPRALAHHCGPRLFLAFHDTDGDVLDERPQVWHLIRVWRFLDGVPAGTPVHVHCFAGISRSPAVASAALAYRCPGWTDHAVVAAVQAVRPQAQPNADVLGLADLLLGRRLQSAWRRATHRF